MKTPPAIPSVETLVAEYPALAEWVRGLEAKNRILEAARERDREMIAFLQEQLEVLKRHVFGAKSERFVPDMDVEQLPLFSAEPLVEEPEERVVQTVVRTKHKKKPVRQALSASLPRDIVVIEPEGDLTGLRRIGEEVTESLDFVPGQFRVRRTIRPKYVDPRDESRGVIVAPMPARAVDKGIAEPGLLAHVVAEKYLDHLPIYRQAARFRREGVVIAESTIGDWIAATATRLLPLYEALAHRARASGYLQADETSIKVLSDPTNENKKAKRKPRKSPGTATAAPRGWYWFYFAVEPGLVLVEYLPSRGREGPRKWLQGYKGLLQTDGYAAYDEIDPGGTMIRAACWAHARRKFFEALGSAPKKAEHALAEIKELYRIEADLREAGASPAERARVRTEMAAPILKKFRAWLEENPSLPKTPFGQAAHYALARWDYLTRYVSEGRLEIDSNLVENQIRPVACGRRNFLFAGSDDAAQRAAVIYSLLGTCKRHDINPWEWLKDVLTRLPTHPADRADELLPPQWKAAREEEKTREAEASPSQLVTP